MVPGEAAWFTVMRDGRKLVIPVTLGARALTPGARWRRLAPWDELSHVDERSGAVQMVDVGAQAAVARQAVARGARAAWRPRRRARLRDLPKGDALATAQLAGIMAAKRTSELIPLCHPLPLSHVDVELDVGEGARRDHCVGRDDRRRPASRWRRSRRSPSPALTVYDMAKAIDKGMVDREITLVEKTKEAA